MGEFNLTEKHIRSRILIYIVWIGPLNGEEQRPYLSKILIKASVCNLFDKKKGWVKVFEL